jgi:V/A-type H+-transporting ATPase subunit C
MAKVKRSDYLFASARVRAVEHNLLGKEYREKMLEAGSPQEALEVLYDCHYGEVGEPLENPADFEEMLKTEQQRLVAFMTKVVPGNELLALFFYPNDYHNLKTLLKAEKVDRQPEDILSSSGSIPVQKLQAMLKDREFAFMTERMRAGTTAALDAFARTGDPQVIDLTLDRYCYEDMVKAAEDTGSDFVIGYVARRIDTINIKAFIRVRQIGKSWDFFRQVFIDDGYIPGRLFAASFEEPLEQVAEKLIPFGFGHSMAEGTQRLKEDGKFTTIERMLDDELMDYVRDAKYIAYGIEPLVGFLVAKENDIQAARMIMTGKLSGLSSDAIRERLRKSYV